MILSGNVALESMGFKTLGFGGGRVDIFEPTEINWGPETTWPADERYQWAGGAWTSTPVKWSHEYLTNLFSFEWELTKSPAGAGQWEPKGDVGMMVPDAHDPKKLHKPIMLTTDPALREDPKYKVIARRFMEHPDEFEAAFAKAWFKLTHRDMGPRSRLPGSEVPEALHRQDPVPAVDYPPPKKLASQPAGGARRPRHRFQRAASRHRGGVWRGRRQEEARQRLRGGLVQSNEAGSFRSRKPLGGPLRRHPVCHGSLHGGCRSAGSLPFAGMAVAWFFTKYFRFSRGVERQEGK